MGYLEAEDVAAAYRYAKEHLAHERIYLRGFSMGAAAVLRAVHEDWVQPEGIILEAVFTRLLSTIQQRFQSMGLPAFPSAQVMTWRGGQQFGFNAFAYNPVDYARSVNCPALFIHGGLDTRAPLSGAQEVMSRVAGPTKILVADDLGHASYARKHPGVYRQALLEFIQDPDT